MELEANLGWVPGAPEEPPNTLLLCLLFALPSPKSRSIISSASRNWSDAVIAISGILPLSCSKLLFVESVTEADSAAEGCDKLGSKPLAPATGSSAAVELV